MIEDHVNFPFTRTGSELSQSQAETSRSPDSIAVQPPKCSFVFV